MKTFLKYWIARIFKSRRSAGAIAAARTRKLNRQAAIDAQQQQAQQ